MALGLFAVFVSLAAAQNEERLWMPEGYRLLTTEELASLPADQVKAISSRNDVLLREAIAGMPAEERQDLIERLQAFRSASEVSPREAQYITMVSMLLLSMTIQDKVVSDRAAEEERFRKLLREQEETSKGFPSDRESVEKEAADIEQTLGRRGNDLRALYLRTLRPLRARPWNDAIRVPFRKIVRGDSFPRQQATSLYDAALEFLHAREKETPSEGAWFSLEAFLRLSMRSETAEAKKLFDIAVAKNANDVESRIFPLLIAEIEGNRADADRLAARAREAWPEPRDLDRVLFDSVDLLPEDLRAKARDSFLLRYKKAHPADWTERTRVLALRLEDGHFAEVERETGDLIGLPVSVVPEPHRSELLALNLAAKAEQGRCDEARYRLAALEAEARLAYPPEVDPDVPPRAHGAGEVRSLRETLANMHREVVRLKAMLVDGSFDRQPDLTDVAPADRRGIVEDSIDTLQTEISAIERLPLDREDALIAEIWSRQDYENWEESVGIRPGVSIYDLAGKAERLSIRARSAIGKCLLAAGRAAEAAEMLSPCAGNGPNFHWKCDEPLVDAGLALVAQNRPKDAAVVYRRVFGIQNLGSRVDDLFGAIEKAAPGSVSRRPPPPPVPTVPVP